MTGVGRQRLAELFPKARPPTLRLSVPRDGKRCFLCHLPGQSPHSEPPVSLPWSLIFSFLWAGDCQAWPRSRKTAGAAPTNGPRGTRNGSKSAQRTLAQPSESPICPPPLTLALTHSPLKA